MTTEKVTGNVSARSDREVLEGAVAAVTAAGEVLKGLFTGEAYVRTWAETAKAFDHNDGLVLDVLRPALKEALPSAGWIADELEEGPLPDGEWWVCDPAEGNINHLHGLPDWGVAATLVRDNEPVLTAVHLPLTGDVYTAIRGGGAFRNEQRLTVSEMETLGAAVVGTGQAGPFEDRRTHRLLGESCGQMLEHALLLKVTVPATLQLIDVARGSTDGFWQFSAVRSGLAGGALMVREAGGIVTDVTGARWTLAARNLVAATPSVHQGMCEVLAAAEATVDARQD
jgi:myo-inositol-1(or 4)-monophosphatase